ncbi:MAG: TspO/MBR family protein [Anaerolineae bacterium]
MNHNTLTQTSTSSDLLRQILNVVAVIATIVFNGLSQSLRLGGTNSAEVSNSFPVYFVPANFTFSIWGVIYLLLIAFAVYQALPSQRTNIYARRIGWLFIVTCVLNCAWITAFQFRQFWVSVLIIVALLATLILIYQRLGSGQQQVSTRDYWFYRLPFSVYLGWVSVATIANLTVTLYSAGWDGFGLSGPVWAAIMLVIGGVLGAIMLLTRRDVAFALVILWAFGGIVSKQAEFAIVAGTALAVIVALVVLLVVTILRNRQITLPRGA